MIPRKRESMSNVSDKAEAFEVAIAVAPTETDISAQGRESSGVPGYDEAWGRRGGSRIAEGGSLLKKGDDVLRIATEAIASQIGITARRIADAIESQSLEPSGPEHLALKSVEVSFGVTLTAGVQAYFTAQGSSSAQVTITLGR
jgi:hypothetical protein